MPSPANNVIDGCHVLGVEDTGDPVWGHVSLRDADGRGVWMKAGAHGFDEVDDEDVILVGFDNECLSGTQRVPLESHLHLEMLRARPDVASVVHTHSPCAIALAATGHTLHAFSNAAGPFASGVPRYERPVALIDTPGLGAELTVAIGDSSALFLVAHGVVTVGSSVATAVTTAILLERACRLELLALGAGGITSTLSDSRTRYRHTQSDAYMLRTWEYLLRVARRRAGGVS